MEGRLVVARGAAAEPVAGEWVTLHRVAGDASGPLDSIRTDRLGRYTFRYRPTGSQEALYFASTRYGGVAYFTAPLRGANVAGEAAEIAVFDTTSSRVPTTVRGRHLVVAAPTADGSRNVIEVFEVSNDSSVTAVEREGANSGTWSTAVSRLARQLQVREGEVPPDALVFADGRAVLRMPFAPGLKQIAFSYVLAPEAFPLEVVADAPATVFEVLLEDPKGAASGSGLVGVEPVTVEGRPFQRFLAQDVRSNARVVIDVPRPPPSWIRFVVPALLGTVGVAMAGALASPRRRRAALPPSPQPAFTLPRPVDERTRLASEIAALDDAFERESAPVAGARAAYELRRAELKARLADLMTPLRR